MFWSSLYLHLILTSHIVKLPENGIFLQNCWSLWIESYDWKEHHMEINCIKPFTRIQIKLKIIKEEQTISKSGSIEGVKWEYLICLTKKFCLNTWHFQRKEKADSKIVFIVKFNFNCLNRKVFSCGNLRIQEQWVFKLC